MTLDETHGTVSLHQPSGAETAESVIDGWSRLFAYLAIAIVVAIAIVMPFVGLVIALPATVYLRAGDAHAKRRPGGLLRLLAGPLTSPVDLARGLLGTVLSLPYAVALTLAVPYLIMMFAVVRVEVHPLTAAAWGVGAGVYVLLAGPGLRAPRRQLVRAFGALAPEPVRIALLGVLLCATSLTAVAGAIVLPPTFAPVYELKNSIAQTLSQFQDSVQQRAS